MADVFVTSSLAGMPSSCLTLPTLSVATWAILNSEDVIQYMNRPCMGWYPVMHHMITPLTAGNVAEIGIINTAAPLMTFFIFSS